MFSQKSLRSFVKRMGRLAFFAKTRFAKPSNNLLGSLPVQRLRKAARPFQLSASKKICMSRRGACRVADTRLASPGHRPSEPPSCWEGKYDAAMPLLDAFRIKYVAGGTLEGRTKRPAPSFIHLVSGKANNHEAQLRGAPE